MNEEIDYVRESFTKAGDNINLEIDNLNVSCITSKNNKFNIDSEGNLTVKSINASEGVMSNESIFNFIYPVGSVYINVENINPNIIFGGKWEQIKDRFLLGNGEIYENGVVGGEIEHTLTIAEIPSHTHTIAASGGHSHTAKFKEMAIGTAANGTRDHARKQTTTDQDSTARVTVSDGAHTHVIANTGNGVKHNNMPPYLTVYIWKRVE